MKRLPILGEQPLPVGKRPKCLYCLRPLKPNISQHWERKDGVMISSPTHRTFRGSYSLHNLFCGPLHATQWALVVASKNIDSINEELRKKEKAHGH